MSRLLIPSAQSPDVNGRLLGITPETAGWRYIGFEVYALKPGQSLRQETGTNEVVLLLLSGIASAATKHKKWDRIGGRMDIFEQIPPYSVYVPPADVVTLTAETDVEVAVCAAPGKGTYEARLIAPENVDAVERGSGDMTRVIHNVLPETEPADSLFIFEVYTPNGNWSSYPPHKHDEDNLPHEAYLEETYYHRIKNPGGFAIQRVYTADGSLNETITVKDGDLVLVPKGFHPVSAPPGYDLYYLNVMAGPVRTWKFTDDPDHVWLKSL